MPQLQKYSGNIKDMVNLFERSVLPGFAIVGKDMRFSLGEFAGAGPRITGPDNTGKKMLDVLNAIQIIELDRKLGTDDGMLFITRTYDLFVIVRRRLDDLLKGDLVCIGGEATVRLLLARCSEEFRRMARAVWPLNATAKAVLWLEKKVARHRLFRRWPVRPGI